MASQSISSPYSPNLIETSLYDIESPPPNNLPIVEEIPSSLEGKWAWGRLLCNWNEIIEEGGEKKIHTHTYAACIDGENGDIYPDDTPGKIFKKCIAQLFVRPLFTLAKTVYALSFISVFCEIKKYTFSHQSGSDTLKNIGKSVANIALSPIFGTILTIATLAAILFEIVGISNIYESRKVIGRIEQLSNWGEVRTKYTTLAPCFQPYSFEETLKHYGNNDQDLDYEKTFSHFARDHVTFEQRGDNACLSLFSNQSCQTFFKGFSFFSCAYIKDNEPYKSPILDEPPFSLFS